MYFKDRRGRRTAVAAAALAATLFGILGHAGAAPLDEPFVGGMGFSGPTDGDPGAIYWNPAALGVARGFQVMFAGSGRRTTTTIERQGFDPYTGAPTGQPGTRVSTTDLTQPIQWPIGPGTYFGVSSDIGGDRFALGFATYMPFLQQVHYPLAPSTGDEPTRYHALTIDLRNLALVPALAIRFGSDFRIGFAPGFMFSTGHLLFAEDTALSRGDCANGMSCSVENPAAAARYDISSGQGISDAKFSVTLAVGVYWRRRNFTFGLAYQSQPLASNVDGVEVAGRDTTVTVPPRDPGGGAPLTCGAGQSTHCVFGDVSYRLPDVFIGGMTWHIASGLELTATARWLRLHVHDRIDIRLTGPTLDAAGLPEHIVLYRGFQDVLDGRVRVSYWWHERVRIGGMLRLETAGVDARAVSPAAVDGFKLEPVVLAEVRLGNRIWLGGGYGLTIMPSVTVNDSIFDPTAATKCATAGGDLHNADCLTRLAGQARPTAAGHYSAFTQDFGLTLTMKF